MCAGVLFLFLFVLCVCLDVCLWVHMGMCVFMYLSIVFTVYDLYVCCV